MAQFFDQDNPYALYSRSDVYSKEKSTRHADSVSTRSYSEDEQRKRARVEKRKQSREDRKRRMAAFAIACMIAGGTVTAVTPSVVDAIQETAIVNDVVYSFEREVVGPNTHRTDDKQHFFYDYDDIAAAIMADGKDFSAELFKAYSAMGEYQTNRVLKYTDYDSVEDYAKQAGFESIKDWKKSEKKKIVLNEELNSKKEELNAMHSELNSNSSGNTTAESYGGGK